MGVMFIVSSASESFLCDVTCASAGVTPKPPDGWRVILNESTCDGDAARSTNADTPEEAHPPAIMLRVRDLVRLIVWMLFVVPGVRLLISKGGIGSASKRVLLRLASIGRFATQLPAATIDLTPRRPPAEAAPRRWHNLTLIFIFLALVFGWCSSPGEYGMFAWLMNSVYCASGPPPSAIASLPSLPFQSLTNMDDTVMVEWDCGSRLEYATQAFWDAIGVVYSDSALNVPKWAAEGEWTSVKTCLGIDFDISLAHESIWACTLSLPTPKRDKVTSLLADPIWDSQRIPLRTLQSLVGLLQFQASVAPTVGFFLPALHLALATQSPGWVHPAGDSLSQALAWEELADSVTFFRAVLSDSSVAPDFFTAPMVSTLPPREQLRLPLALRPPSRVIGSDATGDELVRGSVWAVTDYSAHTYRISISSNLNVAASTMKSLSTSRSFCRSSRSHVSAARRGTAVHLRNRERRPPREKYSPVAKILSCSQNKCLL